MDGHIKPSRLFELADPRTIVNSQPEWPHIQMCEECRESFEVFVQQLLEELASSSLTRSA
jgi:hypothetical protein